MIDEMTEEFLRESNAIEGVYDDLSLSDAMDAWEYLIEQDYIDVKVINKTHRILMRNQPLDPRMHGRYRRVAVYIGRSEAPLWPYVTQMMKHWMARTNGARPDWKALHIEYEHIHPFVDGNGRTGRMFMNWTRMNRLGLPVLVIKESEKRDYYGWFRKNI